MKVLVLLILIIAIGTARSQVEPYGTEICRLFADGVKLRSPGSCSKYLVCDGGTSVEEDCGSKPYDRDSQVCATKTSDTYCKDPCTSKSPSFVADPKSCEGYYACVSGKGTAGECLDGLHFVQDTQSCVYVEDSECLGYDYCDIAPNNVPFKDESGCNTYYMCVKNVLTELICETGYYHPQKGCVNKSEVECEDHPPPVTVCGTTKRPIRNKFVSDERTCRGYWYCSDVGDNTPDPEPRFGQCPSKYFFNYDEQACLTASNVKCDDDRCDGQNREKVISGTKGCRNYLICDGDVTVAEEQCEGGMYFDDSSMTCTREIHSYAACT